MLLEQQQAQILLVDDRRENLLALEAVLAPLGHRLVFASSGDEALKCLLKQDFALILLDVQMQGLSGLETAQMIKGRRKTQHIPIIFLTAFSKDDDFVFKGYSVGAVDYIFKPFDPDILRSKVNVFIELFLKNEQLKSKSEMLRQAEIRERQRAIRELKRASDLRYRNLAESIPQLVWTLRADDTGNYFNQRWFHYTGLSYEESCTNGLHAVLHPDDRSEWERRWENAKRTGEGFEFEARLRRGEDQLYCWHLVHVLPDRNAEGQILTWLVTCTYIDDMVKAQEALQALTNQLRDKNQLIEAEVVQRTREVLSQKRFMELLINAAPAGIAYVDRQMICRAANPEFIRLAGQVLEQPMHDFALTHDMSVGASLRQVLDTGTFCSIKAVSIQGGQGEADHWDITFHPVQDEHETIDGVLIFSVNVSDRVERERLQREQIEHLQQVDRLKTEFLSVISHELRTPLNYIMGFATVLSDEMAGPLSMQQHKFLQNILAGSERMLHLVNDLLDFAKMQAGKFELVPGANDYAALVQGVTSSLKPLADQKKIRVKTSVPAVMDACCDERRTIQLLTNLVDNAIKFTPAGGRVRIKVFEEGDMIVTEVSDTGIGIAAEDIPKLFIPFQQLDMSSTRSVSGTGLGLSIAKALVESHGGRISARSSGLNKGATFRFTLPKADGSLADKDAGFAQAAEQ